MFEERRPEIVFEKVIEGKAVSETAEMATGFQHLQVGSNVFQYFENRFVRRKQGDEPRDEKFSSAVDECQLLACNRAGSERQGIIHGAERGVVSVYAGEQVLRPVTKQQFVSADMLMRVEDWLLGDVTQ